MECKSCGTEIAEKALICYRCGAATFEAVRRPPAPARAAGGWVWPVSAIAGGLGVLAVGPLGAHQVPDVMAYVLGGSAFGVGLVAGLVRWQTSRRP
ncbi:MAG: hypothetical protein U0Q12_26735 [Vicinamibacterales bacterium]